jgi:DNA repair protein RadC
MVSLKYKRPKSKEPIYIREPEKPYELLRDNWSDTLDHVESMYLLLLSKSNEVLGVILHSTGGTSSTVVDNKTILQAVILSNASAVIMAHNHPSGTLEISGSDITVTRRLSQALNLFNITILDHLILTSDSYTSFVEQGISLS